MRWIGVCSISVKNPLRLLLNVALAAMVFLSGCGVTVREFPMVSQPNTCLLTEIRRPLSTTVTVSCRDETRVVGVATVPGMPVIHAPLEALKAAATITFGGFIFKGAEALATGITKMRLKHSLDLPETIEIIGDIEVDGVIDGIPETIDLE